MIEISMTAFSIIVAALWILSLIHVSSLSFKNGVVAGSELCLVQLEKAKIVKIDKNGNITPGDTK